MRFLQTRRARIITGIVLLAGTVGIGLGLDHCNDELRATYGKAFPDLQKATSAKEAEEVLAVWRPVEGAEDAIRVSMWIDILFALFYASFSAFVVYCATLLRPTPWVARLGRWVAVAALIGGAADIIENGFMFAMLGNEAGSALYPAMHIFTMIKGYAILLACCYAVLSHLDS